MRRYLSCCASASLVAPHLRRLVVASPTILTCRCLSCRAGWLLPCYLSLCAAVSLFATSLIAPQSLCVIDPLNPSKKRIGLLGGSSSINPTQRHGTKGLMWGARGQFPPAAAMVVMFVLGRWFTSGLNATVVTPPVTLLPLAAVVPPLLSCRPSPSSCHTLPSSSRLSTCCPLLSSCYATRLCS